MEYIFLLKEKSKLFFMALAMMCLSFCPDSQAEREDRLGDITTEIGSCSMYPVSKAIPLSYKGYISVVKPQPKTWISSVKVLMLNDMQRVERELNLAANAKVSYGPLSLSGSLSALSKYTESKNSFSFIYTFYSGTQYDLNNSHIEPTEKFLTEYDEIKSENDARNFLCRTGTAFSSKVTSGILFYCVITVKVNDISRKNEIQSKFSLDYSNIVDLGTDLSSKYNQSSGSYTISANIEQIGGTSTGATSIQIPALEYKDDKPDFIKYLGDIQAKILEYKNNDFNKQVANLPEGEAGIGCDWQSMTSITNTLVNREPHELIQKVIKEFNSQVIEIDRSLNELNSITGYKTGFGLANIYLDRIKQSYNPNKSNIIKTTFDEARPFTRYLEKVINGTQFSSDISNIQAEIEAEGANIINTISEYKSILDSLKNDENFLRSKIIINSINENPLDNVPQVDWYYDDRDEYFASNLNCGRYSLGIYKGENSVNGSYIQQYGNFRNDSQHDFIYWRACWWERGPGYAPVPFTLTFIEKIMYLGNGLGVLGRVRTGKQQESVILTDNVKGTCIHGKDCGFANTPSPWDPVIFIEDNRTLDDTVFLSHGSQNYEEHLSGKSI